MDELTEGFVAASGPDVGKLQCSRNLLPMSTTAMHMLPHSSFFEHRFSPFKSSLPCLSGCSVERQVLTSEDFTSSNVMGAHYATAQHHQPEDIPLAAHAKHEPRTENVDSCMSLTQSTGLFQPLHQELPRDILQKLLQGSLNLPKPGMLPSFGSSSSEKSPCQDVSRIYHSAVPLPNGGGIFSPPFPSGFLNANPPLLPEGGHYFGKRPWIDEAHNSPLHRRFHLSDEAHGRHVRSSSQQAPAQPHATAALVSGPARPRTRARRGQATDPHSIAERKRREKITNAMKELQELVPTLNKADRIAFVEDVIEYVKFLQLQTKVFIMSRLGNPGASLVPMTAAQGQDGPEAMTSDLQDDNLAVEEEVAQLLEEDIGEALRSLQSKGLYMMPISLASVMPIYDTKQPTGLANLTTLEPTTPTYTKAF